MRRERMPRSWVGWPLLFVLLVACGPAGRPAATSEGAQAPKTPKSVVVGITSSVEAFSNQGGTTTTGGWVSLSEVHSNALITSDLQTRQPIPRLAEKVPTL